MVEALPNPPQGTDIASVHTDLLAWLDRFEQYERVILVDALLDPEGPRGEVTVLSEAQFANFPDHSPSVHQMSPLLALRLFRRLYPAAITEFVLVAFHTPGLRITPAALLPSPSIATALSLIQSLIGVGPR